MSVNEEMKNHFRDFQYDYLIISSMIPEFVNKKGGQTGIYDWNLVRISTKGFAKVL